MAPVSNVNGNAQIANPGTTHKMPEDPSAATLEKKADGYYMTVSLQKSAAAGEVRERVDAKLAETISKAMASGGRIGIQETHEVLGRITDGNRYGDAEKALTRMLLSACDDRREVLLQGVKVRITEAAETVLKRELPKFWGSL